MNTRLIAVETPRGNEMEKAGVALVYNSSGFCFVCRAALPSRISLYMGDLYQAYLPVTKRGTFHMFEEFSSY